VELKCSKMKVFVESADTLRCFTSWFCLKLDHITRAVRFTLLKMPPPNLYFARYYLLMMTGNSTSHTHWALYDVVSGIGHGKCKK